ncbi:MAG: GNAT family N-acetyltransferase [Bacteroidota bacterium]
MYTFNLTENFLTADEQNIFNNYLLVSGLDPQIWKVFECLFNSRIKNTIPLVLRVYKDSELCGVSIVIKCRKYGKALFNNKFLAGAFNIFNVPFYMWLKFGCCMDMMSNTGFVRNPEEYNEIVSAMMRYLKKNTILTVVTDYNINSSHYEKPSILPALPHALINTSSMQSINDYLAGHKNIKRKLKAFEKKGGKFILIKSKLNDHQLSSLKKCFIATSKKSVFYLPYQNLYLNSALTTSQTNIDNVYYFIAYLNDEFLGYQAAIKTGNNLNALHGAFDRNRSTTYHAYDILFVKMTEFAIEHGITKIDFGAVLNYTKQKMVNETIEMSYFLLSKFTIIQWIFENLLKITSIQSERQLKFRDQ